MFEACSQADPLPNLTHDWSAPPWAHTNSSFEHLPGEVILELGEAQVTERRTQSPMRACGSRSRRPAPTVTTQAALGPHSSRTRYSSWGLTPLAAPSVIAARASHMSSPFPRCLSKMGSSVESAVPLWAARA